MRHPVRPVAAGLLPALLAATLVIRAPITAVPPVLSAIRDDLSLSPVAAGLVTTLPLVCFGLFAPITPWLAARIGRERTLGAAVLAIALGIAVRLVATGPTFFGGTLLIGLGIAVANVVIPAIARARFPGSLPRVMGLYTLTVTSSGAAGAFLTRPLIDVTGAGWSWAIGAWLIPAVVAWLWWTAVAVRGSEDRNTKQQVTPMSQLARRGRTWGLALVLGLQSLLFYSLVNWLPTQLHQVGWSVGAAGVGLGAFNLLGIPGAFLGARILAAQHRRVWIALLATAYAGGLLLLAVGPVAALVGVVLCGLCQGPALAVALSAIAHQDDAADVPGVSAIAQGGGYLVAAIGPVLVGATYGATHGFATAMTICAAVALAWLAVTLRATAPASSTP